MGVVSRIVPTDLIWVGDSAPIQWVRTQLKEVAETDLPVLLIGEPGTGRRRAARIVHALGARKDQPFLQVDFGALHPALTEGLLFGRDGAFEQAEGGTIFLEEIEQTSKELQEDLLFHIRARRPSRAPGGRTSGVRVLAAASQDLGRMTLEGSFHPELFYRLNIVPVRLPPLRKRRKDIPPLAAHFVRQCAARMGRRPPRLTSEAVRAMLSYDWPGNVWELKRTLEQAVVLAGDEAIHPRHVRSPFDPSRKKAWEKASSSSDTPFPSFQ